jgi:ABC-type uncharacterized transport system substrate-binding protein
MLLTVRAKKKMKRMFIVLPNTSYLLLQLQSGLLTALEAYSQIYGFFPYQYCIFTLEDDFKNGITDLSHRLSTESYDIIFTVGTQCTQIVKTLFMKVRISTPIIFGGVLHPEQIFLTTKSLPLVAGVKAEPTRYDRQIEMLLMLTQRIKKVLILQSNTATTRSELYAGQKIITLLAQHGIHGYEAVVDDMKTFQTVVNPYVSGIDLILMLRRNIFMSHIRMVVELSHERGIPLYSSDLSSVYKGATLGFSDFDYRIGFEMVKKSLPFLVKGGHTFHTGISLMPWEEKVIINEAVAKRHNFIIDKDYAESIPDVSFI